MADSSIPITGGAGYNVDTRTTASGDHREVVVVGDPTSGNVARVGAGGDQSVSITTPTMAGFGVFVGLSPDGGLNVSGPATSVFADVFDTTVDVTDRWNSGGTITPTTSGGTLTLAAGVANSASTWVSTIPTFSGQGVGFSLVGAVIDLESTAPVNPNCHRFWGLGQVNSYTAATPVTDGAGFEIDIDGALQCVVYIGGIKYVVNSTNTTNISSSVAYMGGSGTAAPTGAVLSNYGAPMTWRGGICRFALYYRPEAMFWYGEGKDPIAVAQYLIPNIVTLPLRLAAITTPTGTVQSTTFGVQATGVFDTTSSSTTLSDGTFAWRKANIGKSGGLSVKGAVHTPLSGTLTSGSTGTIGPLDVSEAGNATFIVKSTAPAVPYTGAPVLVFEQSDDSTSWASMPVVRSDTGTAVPSGTVILPAGVLNSELMFASTLEGVTFVRCRVTTGTTANSITINIQAGGLAFSSQVAVISPSDVRQMLASLTLTSGQAVTSPALNGQVGAAIQITGTWTGVLTFEGTLNGSTWVALNATQVGSSNQLTSTTTVNGLWHVSHAAFVGLRVRCSTTGTGTATVSLSSTANPAPPDQVGLWRADNVPRVAVEPTAVFTDSFEAALDVTDRWITGGTTIPTVALGQASMNTGTAALAQSYMRSQPVFTLYSSAFQRVAMIVAIEAGVLTGNHAWWGLGVPSPTPTVASPITNGLVFEILDTDGLLYGAVYSGGTRVQSVALARPTDAGQHRYNIFSQTSRLYFEIDNIVVGSIALPNTQIGSLPLTIGSVNGASILGVARTVSATIFGLSDTGRNATQISDGTFQWRKAQIGKSGGLAVRGATIPTTSAAVGAAATGTIGPLDVSEAGNATFIVKNTVADTAYTGAPVLVFEQSDDSTSWAALVVVRSDTSAVGSTFTLASGAANAELMFDAAAEGVNYVRCRITTGPTANSMTVVIQPGGLAYTPVVASVVAVPSYVTGSGPAAITSAATDTLLLAANGLRRGASIYNDSTAILYLSLGSNAASTSAYTVKVPAAGYFELPFAYAGMIRGIWSAANGAATVTEVVMP